MTTPNATDFHQLREICAYPRTAYRHAWVVEARELLAAYDAQSTELKDLRATLSSQGLLPLAEVTALRGHLARAQLDLKGFRAHIAQLQSERAKALNQLVQTPPSEFDALQSERDRALTQRNVLRAELQVARGRICRLERPLRDEISRLNGVVRQLEGFNDELMIVAETPKPAGVPEEVLIYLRARGGGGRAKQLLQKYDFELRAKRIQELRRELTTLEGENQ